MDAALAAPALALALREFPASVSAEPVTLADVDLQRAILRTVRCGCPDGTYAEWHDVAVGLYCVVGFVFVCVGGIHPERAPRPEIRLRTSRQAGVWK